MSWGARQLKGFVVGSESDSAPKLQVQESIDFSFAEARQWSCKLAMESSNSCALPHPVTPIDWDVMSWGARQLKGFVVGSESDSAPKLQVQELVLISDNSVASFSMAANSSTKLSLE
jgi:hypothetical protein